MKMAPLVLVTALLGCASTAPIQDRAVSPVDRAPLSAQRLSLPAGAKAVAVFAQERGEGVIALADGHFLAVGPRGDVHPLDRLPGEVARAGETPVSNFASRGSGDAFAIVPSGALVVERGVVRRESLEPFLSAPRAFALLGGNDVLWATSGGLYANYATRWFSLEAPSELALPAEALRGVAQIVPLALRGPSGARDAWVRVGARLVRVHLEAGERAASAAPKVTWADPTPGVALGGVQSIARVDLSRGAVVSDRGVTIVAQEQIHTFHDEPRAGLPRALAGGGGWAWVAWNGRILRTDGEIWESLATNVTIGQDARIAVDEGTGSFALVLDGEGGVWRIQAEEALFTSGLADGATTFDTKVEFEVTPMNAGAIESVSFAVDGKAFATRREPPWGWGENGARAAELATLGFGAHRVDVRARFGDGRDRARTIRFDYGSPLGRVPSYDADIAPIYDARCGSCHTDGVGRGVARDLSSYERLSSQAGLVRASIREGRMPPDLRLDPVSASIFTAWVDGRTPK